MPPQRTKKVRGTPTDNNVEIDNSEQRNEYGAYSQTNSTGMNFSPCLQKKLALKMLTDCYFHADKRDGLEKQHHQIRKKEDT